MSELAAPTTDAERAPANRRGGLSWLAILMGAGVDVAGTRVSSTLLSVAIGVVISAAGSTNGDGAKTAATAILESRWLSAVNITMGLLWSVAGGYFAGYLAKRRQVVNAALAGSCAASFGLASQAIATGVPITPWLLALTATTLPAAMLGGWLASRGTPAATPDHQG
jgi:hypothetical protein